MKTKIKQIKNDGTHDTKNDYIQNKTLKGPSHQIRFAWKWYDSLGLGEDM
jgi:hypothetical protein